MKIDIVFEAQLREVAGKNELSIQLGDNQSVVQALQQVSADSVVLRERLLTSDGHIHPSVLVFINDHPVSADSIHDRQLQDGDSLLLLPPISGG